MKVLLAGAGKGCGSGQSRGLDTLSHTGLHICWSQWRQGSEVLRAAQRKGAEAVPPPREEGGLEEQPF